MFGKISKQFKKSKGWLGKVVKQVDEGSKWLGKNITNLQLEYNVGKKYLKQQAAKADHFLGSNGSVQDVLKKSIGLVENNPLGVAISNGLSGAKTGNDILRKNVLENKKLKKFINT